MEYQKKLKLKINKYKISDIYNIGNEKIIADISADKNLFKNYKN